MIHGLSTQPILHTRPLRVQFYLELDIYTNLRNSFSPTFATKNLPNSLNFCLRAHEVSSKRAIISYQDEKYEENLPIRITAKLSWWVRWIHFPNRGFFFPSSGKLNTTTPVKITRNWKQLYNRYKSNLTFPKDESN